MKLKYQTKSPKPNLKTSAKKKDPLKYSSNNKEVYYGSLYEKKLISQRNHIIEAIAYLQLNALDDYKIADILDTDPRTLDYYFKTYKKEIEEMKLIKAQDAQTPQNVQAAKDFLKGHSLMVAKRLVAVAINPKAPIREQRQASKDALYLAGIAEEVGEAPGGLKAMRAIMMNIYYNQPIPEKIREEIDITPKEEKKG